MIKSGFVGETQSRGKAIPFRQILPGADHSDDTLSWTVEQARRESNQLVLDANEQAQKLLEDAQQQTEQLLLQIDAKKNQWNTEKEELQKKAYEEAFAQGYEEGRNKGYHEVSHLINEAQEIVAASKATLQAQIEENEMVILELAMKASEKIISQQLENSPEKYLPVVKKGIKEAREMKEVKIYIAVQQYTYLQSEREELLAIFPTDIRLYIYPEEELEPYKCFIETANGRIDISIDTQLSELKAGLAEILRSTT
ncbi:flagellar assembly protein FliH [Jeotgalibacillus haloalkalitolerans]|uniref:Flagellar assembly protein FliH n=1 Tax=Jeotgalibacillus haloalkalitolerans TaxID=3104292 RepID=A0ABU5KKQ8_9BACL|nr:flagellar assembly protein FliH [Jeotgalibacillus sp. HH7-29]MDZ5711719.1 flagellar assembly protein FliH [Jeotgalibacillus sp. HH7-29]